MANPTSYDPSFSFGHLPDNEEPTDPTRGQRLDDELEDISAAINDHKAKMEDVRRSDGALKNQIVRYESLHPSVRNLLGVPGGPITADGVGQAAVPGAETVEDALAALRDGSGAAPMAQATFKGRLPGSGAGTPADVGYNRVSPANYANLAAAVASALSLGFALDLRPGDGAIVNVPSQATSISAALTAVRGWAIPAGATVTIQVADGTYDMADTLVRLEHPDGARMSLIGNISAPGNCILRWSASASGAAAVYVPPGCCWGLINGFEIQSGTTVAGRVAERAGILADCGSYVRIGTATRVRRFWFNIFARLHSLIDAFGTSSSDRVEVYDGGDAGFIALLGATIRASYAYAYGSTTVPDLGAAALFGSGFVAENGGHIQANYAVADACMWTGFWAGTNGSIRGPSLTATNSTGATLRDGNGLTAEYGGIIDAGGGTITGNAGYGMYRDGMSQVITYGTMTVSGNGLGDTNKRVTLGVVSHAALIATGPGTNESIQAHVKGAGSFYVTSSAGGILCEVAYIANAVNRLIVQPSATGLPLTLSASGSDTNISLRNNAKGAGGHFFGAATDRELRAFARGGNDVMLRSVNPSSDTIRPMSYEATGHTFKVGTTADASAGTTRLVVDSTGIGFYGSAAIAKPTVSGSRGGNAALASLCTALANLGLITDSTS